MRLPPSSRRLFGAAFLWCVAGLPWLACGKDTTDGGGDGEVSDLRVTVNTAGPASDPNGYTISIEDEGVSRGIGANAAVTINDIPIGSHRVQLEGLADNCAVSGTNPKAVTIEAKHGLVKPKLAVTTFQVICGVSTGGVSTGRIVVTTKVGDIADPDGYRLLLDGADQGVIESQGSVTLNGVTTSQDHRIALTGVNGNCQVQGENPRTVQLVPEQQADVTFEVSCQAPPAAVGAVRVTTITTGDDQDPTGYAVSLDDGPPQAIGINATATISGLSVGDHTIQISDLADNCAVAAGESRTVSVSQDGTTDVSFEVACTARPGSIKVTTVTRSAAAGDYTVSLDGGTAVPIEANASYTFQGVSAGVLHTVELAGLAAECEPDGGAFQMVNVEGGQTTQVRFTVFCNTSPVAADDPDYQDTAGDTLTTNRTNGVLVNDVDPDGEDILVLDPDAVAGPPGAAYFKMFPNGGFKYFPQADLNSGGMAQFTYQAVDPHNGISNVATVTITVQPRPNSPPVATDDNYSMFAAEGVLFTAAPGLLANDSDPDADLLQVQDPGSIVPPGSAVSFQVSADGSFSYTPFPGFVGSDVFTYQAVDEDGAPSGPATVTITVQP